MKTKFFLLIASCVAAAPLAQAADYDDFARVLSVAPRTEQFNQPRQECWTDYQPARAPERSYGGAVLGGITGALLGSQVGKGNGRVAGAAVGAATGAMVGDRMQNSEGDAEQPVQRCRTVDNWQSRVNGYLVTYDYHGRHYTDTLPYDPGDRLRVRVQVTPMREAGWR